MILIRKIYFYTVILTLEYLTLTDTYLAENPAMVETGLGNLKKKES